METKMPDVLYKYKPMNEFTMKILTDGDLYFPSISQLNDPFEGSIPYIFDQSELTAENIFLFMHGLAQKGHPDWTEEQILQYVYEEQMKGRLFNDKHIEQQNKETREDVERLFGILSLTTRKNNFIMWSHYAASHTGICIGFDMNKVFDAVKGTLGKVTYQTTLPVKHLNDAAEQFIHNLLFTKSNDWEYEDEYRLIKTTASKASIRIPLDAILEITFGCKIEQVKKNEIIEVIKDKIPGCKIYEASLSKTKFELDIKQIYPPNARIQFADHYKISIDKQELNQ